MKFTKRNILIATGITLVVGSTIAILINRSKKKKLIDEINDILEGNKPDPNQSGGQVIIPQKEYDALPAGKFPLKVGDKNKKVYALQKALVQRHGSTLDMDGKFGQGTYLALCDKYWRWCGASIGMYERTIEQDDFDEIVTKPSETT